MSIFQTRSQLFIIKIMIDTLTLLECFSYKALKMVHIEVIDFFPSSILVLLFALGRYQKVLVMYV